MEGRQLRTIEYVIGEVSRQDDLSGEALIGFAHALDYAQRMGHQIPPLIDEETVRTIAEFVKPEDNADGYRKVPVGFRDLSIAVKWSHIPAAVRHLLNSYNDGRVNADELYQEFLTIHPFKDGNGRVASLLWNLANGTIFAPERPPEYRKE